MKTKCHELNYYGLNACLAIWKKRPDAIVRLYLAPSQVKALKPLMKWCAQHRRPYHLVSMEELNRIADSVHHEGICLRALKPTILAPAIPKHKHACLVYLDGVQNPHNLGAILRSAAHFSVAAIAGKKESLPSLSPSACRIAMGGAEEVPLLPLENPLSWLSDNDFTLIAASQNQGEPLYQFKFPPRSALIFGSETDGVNRQLLAKAKHVVQIPGSGSVESLNVSVAAALLMSEYYRQHRP